MRPWSQPWDATLGDGLVLRGQDTPAMATVTVTVTAPATATASVRRAAAEARPAGDRRPGVRPRDAARRAVPSMAMPFVRSLLSR